ncbi:MAG: MBL fold metallo-hydrolase [Hydrogenophaga sp.]|nr:MBL fold metallo-hydrolase [Hydrogenophaga sp.]
MGFRRSRWGASRLWALGLWAAAALWPTAHARTPTDGCEASPAVPWQALAPGVWVWHPSDPGEVSALNGGHVAPTTALVAGADALVIDPGPSHRHGERVRSSLACRFGAEVRWIVNTHAHAENVLANSAFADRGAAGQLTVWASEATRAAMQQRCPGCLASLTARVGAEAMAGTRIVLPTHTLQEGQRLTLGPMVLEVMPVERGHTEGDLVLWNAEHRLLWAGGLVYGERIPELAQGRLDGWLDALNRLQALGPTQVVATVVSVGAEPGQVPSALLGTRAYLLALRQGVLRAMDEGRQPQEVGVVDLPAYRSWVGYAERHAFNVQRAWRELEPVWMEQGAPSALPLPGQMQPIQGQ